MGLLEGIHNFRDALEEQDINPKDVEIHADREVLLRLKLELHELRRHPGPPDNYLVPGGMEIFGIKVKEKRG